MEKGEEVKISTIISNTDNVVQMAGYANEIKALVENTTKKANGGKVIAVKMIEGYAGLNDNITKTITIIKDIESANEKLVEKYLSITKKKLLKKLRY